MVYSRYIIVNTMHKGDNKDNNNNNNDNNTNTDRFEWKHHEMFVT